MFLYSNYGDLERLNRVLQEKEIKVGSYVMALVVVEETKSEKEIP